MATSTIPLKPGYIYHIWTHANGDENLFRCEENYNYFLKKYLHHVHPIVDTFAYCLMPNHLHLMVRICQEKELRAFGIDEKGAKEKDLSGFQNLTGLVSQQFSNLFNAYTKAFNKKYDRKGSLFKRPFQRKLIDSDHYFTQLIAYIHNNPIHHGFTRNLNDWPFNSWHAYVMDKMTKVKKDEAMQWFGDVEHFMAKHQQIDINKCMKLFES